MMTRMRAYCQTTISAAILLGGLLVFIGGGCGDEDASRHERVHQVAEVSEHFVSFAVDMDQLVGGTFWDPAGGNSAVDVPPYDFSRPRLRNLTRALAPAFLRLGGSASDRTYYDLSDDPLEVPPLPFEEVLTREQWDAAVSFAEELGLSIIFTVNAGPGPRDADKRWLGENARELLEYVADRGDPLAVLEFGNEPNLFAVRAGIAGYTAEDFERDLGTFRALRDELVPNTPIFGPGTIYTRTQGEDVIPGVVFGPRATQILPLAGSMLDGVNYHYYAAVSTRCPVGPRVSAETALDPAYIDGIDEAASAVDALQQDYAPGRSIWLTETGGQSCGGQIGIADRFVNTFWFLNSLGRLARRGHEVVVRQTLSGSTYGLVDEVSLEPRPDYWAALLWRRLMGTRVLQLPDIPAPAGLRLYAHCERGGAPGAVTLLVLNLDANEPIEVDVGELGLGGPVDRYLVTGNDLFSREVMLNGELLTAGRDGTLPEFVPWHGNDNALSLPAASWVFVVFPDARVDACR